MASELCNINCIAFLSRFFDSRNCERCGILETFAFDNHGRELDWINLLVIKDSESV